MQMQMQMQMVEADAAPVGANSFAMRQYSQYISIA